MTNLITYEDISRLARPCTTEQDMAEALIAEAQRVEVKPRLGDALYVKIMDNMSDKRFGLLLDGGAWTDDCGEVHLLTGVKTALAYYTLARITRDGNIQETTYGSVVKDDQYSADPEKTERQRQYRELFGQADSYMAEVLVYLSKNRRLFPEYKSCGNKMRSNRMTIRTIGR